MTFRGLSIGKIQNALLDTKPVYVYFIMLLGSIFVVEALIMAMFYFIPIFSSVEQIIVDATILSIIVTPLLFLLALKPLTVELQRRKKAQQCLEDYKSGLENLVRKRTMELEREIDERKQAQEALSKHEERLKFLIRNLIAAQERERANLARELHDHMGQQLTAMTMILESLGTTTSPMKEKTDKMSELMTEISASLHGIYGGLRPIMLEKLGLPATIETLLREFKEHSGIDVKLKIDSMDIPSGGDYAINIYRILQEALTNISRHASANRVEVSIVTIGEQISLCIHDNGKGFHPENLAESGGFGLLGMIERTAHCNGTLKIDSSPGIGTTITVLLPGREVRNKP